MWGGTCASERYNVEPFRRGQRQRQGFRTARCRESTSVGELVHAQMRGAGVQVVQQTSSGA